MLVHMEKENNRLTLYFWITVYAIFELHEFFPSILANVYFIFKNKFISMHKFYTFSEKARLFNFPKIFSLEKNNSK